MHNSSVAALPRITTLPDWLRQELRSDHAGETGAVWLYFGIIKYSRDPMLTAFARSHLKTEQQHLKYFETWLSSTDKSALTPLWRIAGWLLGSLACLGGAPVVYLTIETVETFVIDHYQQQILKLEQQQQYPEVAELLRQFMFDEHHHCQDAVHRHDIEDTWPTRCWRAIVAQGSVLAVNFARRL